MNLLLVAEGVETERELCVLEEVGVRYVQGYLLARPQVGILPCIENDILSLCSAT